MAHDGVLLYKLSALRVMYIEDREGLLFFRDLGGRFRACLGSRHAVRARAKHRFVRQHFINLSVPWNRLRVSKWCRPYATWRRHTKTVPSHDVFELFNPGGFPNYAFVRAPDAREHRKAIIDAEAVVRAIVPLPVLLFGVTTLRVTCGSKIGKVCCFSET